ncbi:MAG TPA: hypothetical protein VMU97_02555, partial [Candidatus Dormibacteraeota bacterium]|nr:hypothetical protein [Candidatus Dormibacteraeota bacterium]
YVDMVCVHCGDKTKVSNSRRQHKGNQVWRRRQCLQCGAVFSTTESVQYELAWAVRRGNRLGPFQRDKLFLSLHRSCQHRKSALSDAKSLTETVIHKLRGRVTKGTLDSSDIALVAQVALNRFDKAASVHYQAFHKG